MSGRQQVKKHCTWNSSAVEFGNQRKHTALISEAKDSGIKFCHIPLMCDRDPVALKKRHIFTSFGTRTKMGPLSFNTRQLTIQQQKSLYNHYPSPRCNLPKRSYCDKTLLSQLIRIDVLEIEFKTQFNWKMSWILTYQFDAKLGWFKNIILSISSPGFELKNRLFIALAVNTEYIQKYTFYPLILSCKDKKNWPVGSLKIWRIWCEINILKLLLETYIKVLRKTVFSFLCSKPTCSW